jgi:hypothetical protein
MDRPIQDQRIDDNPRRDAVSVGRDVGSKAPGKTGDVIQDMKAQLAPGATRDIIIDVYRDQGIIVKTCRADLDVQDEGRESLRIILIEREVAERVTYETVAINLESLQPVRVVVHDEVRARVDRGVPDGDIVKIRDRAADGAVLCVRSVTV